MIGGSACACAQPDRLGEANAGADTCAIIVAGGSGERFGDPRGKQFVELLGLPLVAWSLLAFDRAPSVGALVLVCPAARKAEVRSDVLSRVSLTHEVVLADAGATRQASVLSGLMAAPSTCELVAIHDGARPLIELESIERCLAVVRDDASIDGAICASRTTDTLKIVDADDKITSTPDRSQYWCALTPQSFRRTRILAAHEKALLDGYEGTDDASLMEYAGGVVRVVESPRDNIKVTVPEDLAIAEATLRSRAGIS